MAVTKHQAETEDSFHSSVYTNADGSCQRWRRNGKTQTWKTRPEDFRVPIKYGLRGFSAIEKSSADLFHVASECSREIME